ncbi:hypothetical protein RQP46_001973 [Phenoliferia psychrophenolica]
MSSTFAGVSDVLQGARGLGIDPNGRHATMNGLAMTFGIALLLTLLLRTWIQKHLILRLFRGPTGWRALPKPNSPIRLHPALALAKSFIANKLDGIYLSQTRNGAHRPRATFPVHKLASASEKATSPLTTHLVIQGIGSGPPNTIAPIEIFNSTGVTVLDVVRAVVKRWTSQDGGESEWKKMWKANGPTKVWSGWAGLQLQADGRVELRAKTFGRLNRPQSPTLSPIVMGTSPLYGVSDVLEHTRGLEAVMADVSPDPRNAMHDLAKTFRIAGDEDVLLTVILDHGLSYFDLKRLGGVCKALQTWIRQNPRLDRLLFREKVDSQSRERLPPNSSIRLHPALALSKSFIARRLKDVYMESLNFFPFKNKANGIDSKFKSWDVPNRPFVSFAIHTLPMPE